MVPDEGADGGESCEVCCFFEVLVDSGTLRKSNIAMEHGPFEDVFPIKHGDIPLLC